MKQKELFIIRHGQTDLNKAGIIQGRGVDAPLNDTGRAQGRMFFDYYKNEGFEKVYVSNLQRTYQSVQPFIEELNLPFEKLPGLDEFDWGDYEGTQADYQLKEEYQKITSAWKSGDYDQKIAGGESPNEVKIRQDKALEHILASAEEKVLVCMHGRAIRLLLTQLTGKEISEMDNFPHANLCLYRVKATQDGFEVVSFNCTKHLK